MSIFISIASYRDPLLSTTIESALKNAAYPKDVYFGVIYQGTDRERPDFRSIPNCTALSMHPKDAQGAGFARSLAMELYMGQTYFLQVDSHTLFADHWDKTLIDELSITQDFTNNNRIILSAFPPPFLYQENKKIVIPKNGVEQATYPTKQIPTLNRRSEWTASRVDFSDPMRTIPEESKTVLGGLIFAPGNIVSEVPYDPEISFFGEEICFAMRAWTRGWDIYSPSKIALYHFYTRAAFPKVWKDRNLRKLSWKELESLSKAKQKRVLTGEEQGTFGAGNIRTLEQFEQFVGIDFKKAYR